MSQSGLSIIIPSKTCSNLVPCLSYLFSYEPDHQIIVVDDGVSYPSMEVVNFCKGGSKVKTITGIKKFVFARNVNLGIHAAEGDDVIILNDDALLETPGGFSRMHDQIKSHPEFGLIASSCNNVGNPNQQRRPLNGLREEPRTVCFIAVLIPRSTINKVGLLDESLIHYGTDDDDYCLRTRQAGLKLGIFDGCYVDHSKLTSTYRGMAMNSGDFRPNLKIFIQKHGVDNWGKTKEESMFPECFPS